MVIVWCISDCLAWPIILISSRQYTQSEQQTAYGPGSSDLPAYSVDGSDLGMSLVQLLQVDVYLVPVHDIRLDNTITVIPKIDPNSLVLTNQVLPQLQFGLLQKENSIAPVLRY